MNRFTVARLSVAMALAGGVLTSAQVQLPSEPGGAFGDDFQNFKSVLFQRASGFDDVDDPIRQSDERGKFDGT